MSDATILQFLVVLVCGALCMIVGYVVGHFQGHRAGHQEGYTRALRTYEERPVVLKAILSGKNKLESKLSSDA